MSQAPKRLGAATVYSTVLVGTRLTEGRNTTEDQAGVEGAERLPVMPPSLHGAGGEVFSHHVRVGDEPVEDVAALGLAHVQGDVALVPTLHLVRQVNAVFDVMAGHRRLRFTGPIDLDHVGAHVCQI